MKKLAKLFGKFLSGKQHGDVGVGAVGFIAGLVILIIAVIFVQSLSIAGNQNNCISYLENMGYWVLAGGSHSVPGDLLSSADNTYDIGSAAQSWADGWFNGTLYAKTGRTATIVVAANNSSATEKAQADYVCDGTNDDVEINAAIAALPATGGKVLLSSGTFTVNRQAGVIIYAIRIAKSNVTLEGSGFSSIIYLANGQATPGQLCKIIQLGDGVNPYSNIVIQNLTINGNRANQTAALTSDRNDGIYFHTTVTNSIVQNCYIYNTFFDAVNIYASHYNKVLNSTIDGCGEGIDWVNSNYILVSGNTITNITPQDGIEPENSLYAIISNNHIYNTKQSAINVYNNSDYCQVIGNVMNNCPLDNTSGDDAITIDTCKSVLIQGNVIYNSKNSGISQFVGTEGPIIQGNQIINAISAGIATRVDGTIIKGNEIINCEDWGGGILVGGWALNITVSRLIIEGNIIRDCHYTGMKLTGMQYSIVTGNILYNNCVTNESEEIALYDDGTGYSLYNTIQSNKIITTKNYGINEIDANCNYNTFKDNSISGAVVSSVRYVGNLSLLGSLDDIARTGQYMNLNGAAPGWGTGAIAANTLYSLLIEVKQPMSVDRIAVSTSVAGVGNARLGIYADGTNHYPGALILDAGEVSMNAVSLRTIVINQTLQPGYHHLVILSSVICTLYLPDRATISALGFNDTLNSNLAGFSVAQAYGALPATFTAGGTAQSASVIPNISLRLNTYR